MTRFTDSPFERMMTQKPEGRKKTSALLLYPKATPAMAAATTTGGPVWDSATGNWKSS